MRSLILVGLSFFLGTCAPQDLSPETSCNFVQNSDEQRVSWNGNLPVKFRVHKDVPQEAYDSLLAAASKWNSISTANLIQFVSWSSGGTPASGYADGAPTVYWLSTWESNRSFEQGRTTVIWSGDEIRDADIRINDKDFNFSFVGEELIYNKVDLVSLLVHEFGHALGFAHDVNRASVMYHALGKGTDRRDVALLSDLESFSCEYGESSVKPEVWALARGEEAVEDEESDDEGEATSASSLDR